MNYTIKVLRPLHIKYDLGHSQVVLAITDQIEKILAIKIGSSNDPNHILFYAFIRIFLDSLKPYSDD